MAVQVNYADYNTSTIKSVKINIGKDKYKIMKPIIVNSDQDDEIINKHILVDVVDDTLSLCISHEMDLNELREYIQVLQRLAFQLKQDEKDVDCK